MQAKPLLVILLLMLLLPGCGKPSPYRDYQKWSKDYSFSTFLQNNPEYRDSPQLLDQAQAIAEDETGDYRDRADAVLLLAAMDYEAAKAAGNERLGLTEVDFSLSATAAGAVMNSMDFTLEETWSYIDGHRGLGSEASAFNFLFTAGYPYLDDATLEDVTAALGGMYSIGHHAREEGGRTINQLLGADPARMRRMSSTLWGNGYFVRYYRSVPGIYVAAAEKLDTLEEKLDYLLFVREEVLPRARQRSGAASVSGMSYYETYWNRTDIHSLYTGFDLCLTLEEGEVPFAYDSIGKPSIPLEDGAILVLQSASWPLAGDSPVGELTIDGDAMLNLPRGRFPAAIDEVRYLVFVSTRYKREGYYRSYQREGMPQPVTDSMLMPSKRPLTEIVAIGSTSDIYLLDRETGEMWQLEKDLYRRPPSGRTIDTALKEQGYDMPPRTMPGEITRLLQPYITNEPEN